AVLGQVRDKQQRMRLTIHRQHKIEQGAGFDDKGEGSPKSEKNAMHLHQCFQGQRNASPHLRDELGSREAQMACEPGPCSILAVMSKRQFACLKGLAARRACAPAVRPESMVEQPVRLRLAKGDEMSGGLDCGQGHPFAEGDARRLLPERSDARAMTFLPSF